MVGKKYFRQVTKKHYWIVEVISETVTHVYIRVLEPVMRENGHRWNVSKDWFFKHYTEINNS